MKFKLTSSQMNFYNKNFTLDSQIWNQGVMEIFPQVHSYDKINTAYNKLVESHDSLRLKLVETEDGVVADVREHEFINYRFWQVETEEELMKKAQDFLNEPIDRYGLLVNCAIFNTPTTSGFMINAHHIVVDGFSVIVMAEHMNELIKDINFVPTIQEYPDYIEAEEKYKQSRRFDKARDFWLKEFSNKPECDIFTVKGNVLDFYSEEANSVISEDLFYKVNNFCQENEISITSFFNTIYAVYFSRMYELSSFTMGVPVLNRTTQSEFNTIGLYMHVLPMVCNVVENESFVYNAKIIEDSQMNLLRYQKFTQTDIKEALKETEYESNNLFSIATDYQSFTTKDEYEVQIKYANYLATPIEIHLQSFNETLHNFKIRYRTAYFSKQEIEIMLKSIITLMEKAVETPGKNVFELEVVSASEKSIILNEFNDTSVEYSKEKCIHQLFEEQAERTPVKNAIVVADKKLTYKELNEEANKFAHSLIEKGMGKGDIVGIRFSRISNFIISVLGILKTGAAYLPFDATHPQERNEQILSDSKAKLCITEENFDDFLKNSYTENPDIKISGDDLCYCIYTSGSTGVPKGVMIQHKNLNWYMAALVGIYGAEPINMPFFTSTSVDLSVPSYFLPLVTGGTTFFYDNGLLNDLNDIFNNEEINTIKATPTHLQIILQHIEGKTLSNMKYLISGGESLYRSTCIEFLEKFGKHIEIHNEYGPTEATVSCVDYVFSHNDNDDIVSIGAPIENAQIYIVDKYNNMLPIGVTGELCIAGDGVCAGYLNNPELTEEKFIDNPYGAGKLYKTGDLAYWRKDGNICYVGRNDFQVKIRGLRIELGEIENAITNVDGVIQCAVVVRTDKKNRQIICAFYTGKEQDSRELRSIISTKLPKYMMPHVFVCLDEMPLTSSGKISRNTLPEIDLENVSTDVKYVAPMTEEERILIKCVEDVLDVEKVSLLDNFFDLGGDSLLSIELTSEIENNGYELSVTDIMQSDTLSDIAKAIKTKKEENDEYKDNSSVTDDVDRYEQNEVNGVVSFSPIMRAFLKETNGEILNDFVHTCIMSTECDEKTVQKALDVLITHHDMLRGTFTNNGIEIHKSDERKVYAFESISIDDINEAIEHLKQTKLDDKLVKVVFCHTQKESLICITVHHFLIDLISWEVLMKDFGTVVKQINKNVKISLPAKTASFKHWCEELEIYSGKIPEKDKAYWNEINEKLDNIKAFNTSEEVNDAEEYSFTFSRKISDALINKVNKTYGTRLHEILLTAAGLSASKIAEEDVGIIVESHGRTELHKPIAIEKTIGWFTSCYPVVIKNNENIVEELVNVRETLRTIPKNGMDYLLLNEGFHRNANIKFNFYRKSNSNEIEDNELVEFNGSSSVFPNMINVGCSLIGDDLSVLVSVPKCIHKKDISKELGKEIKKQIEKFVEYADVLPATAAQMRIYTAQAISNEPTLYNLSAAFKMDNFDASRFENAVNKLIARHEGLRTSFDNRNGQVFQRINDDVSIKLEKLETEDISAFVRPFDLSRAPLMRVGYLDNTVIVDFHHIIADGSTFGIFYEEINELYMGRELPEAVQYREFALSDKYTKEDEEYWLKEFEELPDFELYTDYPRQENQSDKGANIYKRIDQKIHENILIKCKKWGVTPYDFYMGCFSILLSKYSGSEDVCIGVPSSGRSSKFLNTWGMFVNTLSIKTKPESTKAFKEFASEIKDKSFNAIAHQKYPQQELAGKLNINKPLYEVMFIFQSEKMTHSVIGDKKAELLPLEISTSRAPIMFYIHPREDDTVVRIEYLTCLYKEETIDKFIEAYKSILEQALNEETLIKDISVLSESEKETLNTFNETEHEYNIEENTTLYSMFEEQARKNAEKVCVIADNKEITYKDFRAFAERIDDKVRKITNNQKSVIAVICERGFEMYGAVYGIIRGGNAYLPIDPNYPQERIDYILSNSDAKAVVTQDKFTHLVTSVPCINATEVLNNKETTEKTPVLANEEDTAYVIYTSGSTGNPKGAKISHKSAVNRILWMHEFYPLEENDVILQKTPYTFDVSVWELFWWGITGRTLCASKPDEHFLPAKILQETNTNKVTHLHFVPSVFDLFLTYLENNKEEQEKFKTVKYVFLSGEALTASSIKRFYSIYDYNKVQLHNLYGPTECAVDVSYYACVPTDVDPVPIGKPIYNTQLHIVDKHLNQTPIGVTGELCIAGVNVGQGYLNNEELTKEKFVDNPFGEGKLYKTGDLAYWREDGQIIYCGRNDFQVKINGQRIELGEIENAINEVEKIDSVALMVMQNHGNDVLVAYCCGENIDETMIKEHCENKLPRYMLPSAFVILDKMPLNASGKLDRKQLKTIPVVFEETVKEEPINDTERMICRIFAKSLSVENVGRNESFFHMGGTSIDMIAVLSEKEMKNVSASQFIANPTPKKLAELMNSGKNAISENFDVLREVEGSDKAMFVVPYAGGDATAFAKFVDTMSKILPDISIYNIDYLHSYEECEKVADLIAGIGKTHKLYIYSHCAGTAVALQIINILEEKGVKIANYIVGGYIPPKKPANKNGWNKVPDKKIKRKLLSAGAPLEKFNDQQNYNMVGRFRKDTDFMVWYHYYNAKKISVQTDAVLSKTDIFTRNYKEAEELWRSVAPAFNRVHFITTDSHYFQSDNSDVLVKIIADIIGK